MNNSDASSLACASNSTKFIKNWVENSSQSPRGSLTVPGSVVLGFSDYFNRQFNVTYMISE